jgi:hypothetical protein
MTNLFGLPGLGSLAAGRPAGYAQMALSLGGLALTTAFAVPAFMWLSSSNNLPQGGDPSGVSLEELWIHVRWALLGFGVFACGWLWSLASGLSILAESRSAEVPSAPRIPPKLSS